MEVLTGIAIAILLTPVWLLVVAILRTAPKVETEKDYIEVEYEIH